VRFLPRKLLAGIQIGGEESFMAKADMTKIDKAEMAKIDKAEATKIDKTDATKIDFDALSIEELATLRDTAGAKLLEKVTARQVELEAEIERLAQYGKPSKKAVATAPVVKTKKSRADDVSESVVADGPASDSPVAAAA
jgi:hypothetical protein